MTNNRSNNKNGFMLLELMISITILGVALVICIQSVSSFLRVSKTSHNITVAGHLSEQILWGVSNGNFAAGENTGNFGDQYPGFEWKVKTEHIDNYIDSVDITILWKEQGIAKYIEIDTLSNRFERKDE
ncbi:MAG: prepilin-type N-terminal cleavage/methylation domain-containing protein [Elusimicrobia bacterium]|nr:prepilin-type N-terminal cleavage/methylation domain-containing protein [Elusimicrobiota bacterium]